MPLPLIPLIAAGTNLLGNAMNTASNARQNRLNREFAQHQYDQQRADALADYEMMNTYNSPAEQMERLKAAGLNPNLVYGGGTTTSSATVRSSSPPSYRGNPAHYDFGGVANGLMMGYQVENTKAQTDNVKEQTKVAIQEQLLKAAQTAGTIMSTAATGVGTESQKFHLGQAQALNDYVLAAAKANLDKTNTEIANIGASTDQTRASIGKIHADTKFTLDQNERAAAMQAPNLAKAVEEVLQVRLSQARTQAETDSIKQNIQNAKSSNSLQELELWMRNHNINPSDPAYMRILMNTLGTPKEFKQSVDKKAKEILDKLNSGGYLHKYGATESNHYKNH